MEPTAGSTSSTDTEREPAERVALGRVVGAHGMGGLLRVRYFSDAPDNLIRLEAVLLAESEDAADAERFEVVRAAPGRRKEVRMTLSGVEDRESGEQLRGKLVVVEASQLEALPEGEYYSYQLVGCRVDVRLEPSMAATVLLHERGAAKSVPKGAKFLVAINKVDDTNADLVDQLVGELRQRQPNLRIVTIAAH